MQANDRERERVAQFQEQMLGIVGHDLRSPLGAILIGAEMLTELSELDRVAPVARRVHSSATRMVWIVDQLLDVTRARLGSGIPLALRAVDLVPLVQSVVDERAHAKAQFVMHADAPVTGRWDPDCSIPTAAVARAAPTPTPPGWASGSTSSTRS